MGRKVFKDFVEVRNLRNGAWVDGKMVSVNFDLHVGPFTHRDISWHVQSGSLRLPCPGKVHVMKPYIQIIRDLATEAVKEMRQKASKAE